jgi:hypothetical protein
MPVYFDVPPECPVNFRLIFYFAGIFSRGLNFTLVVAGPVAGAWLLDRSDYRLTAEVRALNV